MSEYVRTVPIRWNDCDPARIVFHANYIRWMDEGFHEWFGAMGLSFRDLQAADPGFRGSPLVNVSCAFRSPAEYGDVLEHRLAVPESGSGRSFRVAHSFLRDGTVIAEGEQVRIWGITDASGRLRAVPVPDAIAVRLTGRRATA